MNFKHLPISYLKHLCVGALVLLKAVALFAFVVSPKISNALNEGTGALEFLGLEGIFAVVVLFAMTVMNTLIAIVGMKILWGAAQKPPPF